MARTRRQEGKLMYGNHYYNPTHRTEFFGRPPAKVTQFVRISPKELSKVAESGRTDPSGDIPAAEHTVKETFATNFRWLRNVPQNFAIKFKFRERRSFTEPINQAEVAELFARPTTSSAAAAAAAALCVRLFFFFFYNMWEV